MRPRPRPRARPAGSIAEGVELARVNLQRFVALARAIGVARLDVLATAAVRDAADGEEFAAEIERRFGVRVRVLAGAEEGRLFGARRARPAFPRRTGVAGDLGGGSVELVPVGKRPRRPGGDACRSGPLRLASRSPTTRSACRTRSTGISRRVPWLDARDGRQFLRRRRRLARARPPPHGADAVSAPHHPGLHAAARRGREISRPGRAPVAQIAGADQHDLAQAARGRAACGAHPAAAVAPDRAARRWCSRPAGCARAISTACSTRPSSAPTRSSPPAPRRPQLNPRFGADAARRCSPGPAPLFPKEPAPRQRLRRAAALLSDIAWHEHPDYRAEQALRHALYMPLDRHRATPSAPSSRWRCMRAMAAAAASSWRRRSSCWTRRRSRRRGSSASPCGSATPSRAACPALLGGVTLGLARRRGGAVLRAEQRRPLRRNRAAPPRRARPRHEPPHRAARGVRPRRGPQSCGETRATP